MLEDLTPVQFVNINDYNSILLDQIDEKASMHGSDLIHNYRWWFKVSFVVIGQIALMIIK